MRSALGPLRAEGRKPHSGAPRKKSTNTSSLNHSSEGKTPTPQVLGRPSSCCSEFCLVYLLILVGDVVATEKGLHEKRQLTLL